VNAEKYTDVHCPDFCDVFCRSDVDYGPKHKSKNPIAIADLFCRSTLTQLLGSRILNFAPITGMNFAPSYIAAVFGRSLKTFLFSEY